VYVEADLQVRLRAFQGGRKTALYF
jgi:hypothetical protein